MSILCSCWLLSCLPCQSCSCRESAPWAGAPEGRPERAASKGARVVDANKVQRGRQVRQGSTKRIAGEGSFSMSQPVKGSLRSKQHTGILAVRTKFCRPGEDCGKPHVYHVRMPCIQARSPTGPWPTCRPGACRAVRGASTAESPAARECACRCCSGRTGTSPGGPRSSLQGHSGAWAPVCLHPGSCVGADGELAEVHCAVVAMK